MTGLEMGAAAPNEPGGAEWWADLEHVWHRRTAPKRRAYSAKARRLGRGETAAERRRSRWYGDRTRGLAMDRRDRLALCGARWSMVRCECGDRRMPASCDVVELCDHCGKKKWRRYRAKGLRAIGVRLAEERARWQARGSHRRARPSPVLVTGTIRHSGDVAVDRERLEEAWRTLRKNVHHWHRDMTCVSPGCTHRGKDIRANAAGVVRCTGHGDFPYMLTWEMTPGVRKDGHVHFHAVVIWPWLPWDRLRQMWIAATDGESAWIDLQVVNSDQAAHYIAKYASKGFDVSEMTGELAGAGLATFYGKRRVTTSRGFWVSEDRTCPDCGQSHVLVQLPEAMARVAGSALFRAACRTAGVRLATGPPIQAALRGLIDGQAQRQGTVRKAIHAE